MRNLLIPLLPKYGGFKLAKIIKFFLTLIFTIFLILTLLFIIVMTTYVKEKYYVIQLSVIRITKIRNNYSLDFNSYGDTKKTLNLEITSKGKLPENIVIKNINFYNRKISIYNQAIKAFEINKATAEKKEFKINQSIAKLKHNDGYYKDEIAVQDGNLITASSAGSLLWAKFIIEELGLYSKTTVEAWFNYFSTGDPQYYGEMTNSLEKDALES